MLKTLYYIRNKKELQELYLSQMPEMYIRSEINSIINETRKDISAGMRLNVKNIKTEEALIFIDRNGTPDGYLLSEELKIKLNEYREAELKNKQFLNKIKHVS